MTSPPDTLRVHEEDEALAFDVGDFDLVTYQDTPFNGVMFSLYDNGVVCREETYLSGKPYGWQLGFHESGQLAERRWYGDLGYCGSHQEFDAQGRLRVESQLGSGGRRLLHLEWDADGHLVLEKITVTARDVPAADTSVQITRQYGKTGLRTQEQITEFGIPVSQTKWTNGGRVTESWALGPPDPAWQQLEALRAAQAAQPQTSDWA